MHPQYEAYLQDELNGLLRSSGYKKDEESLFLKKFALMGMHIINFDAPAKFAFGEQEAVCLVELNKLTFTLN